MDEYLKTLLEQIRCKKARPYVKQEFQDHIEDQIEANMHAGMDRQRGKLSGIWEILWKQESLLTVSTDLRLHGNFWG